MNAQVFSFSQIHIDAARNSTDDFNPFHDKRKWARIRENPFGGPIVLGFQLECLIEHQIRGYRQQHHEQEVITDDGLRFSNYQFTFANVVRPKEAISVDIKKSQHRPGENSILSNRVTVKNHRGVVLFGYKKESRTPLFLADADFSHLGDLRQYPDRGYVPGSPYFLKRKFMNTGNAKNFLSGSLAEQGDYFDELEGKVSFPEIFPAALISCALLENGLMERHDFEFEPMVYTSHHITVDRQHLSRLKSNDVLHILVKRPDSVAAGNGLGSAGVPQYVYECFGLLRHQAILYRAEIALAPLAEVLKSLVRHQTG